MDLFLFSPACKKDYHPPRRFPPPNELRSKSKIRQAAKASTATMIEPNVNIHETGTGRSTIGT
jgi:hypothetical protein